MKVLEVLKKAWVIIDTLMVVVIFSLVTLLMLNSHASRETSRRCVTARCSEEDHPSAKPERSWVDRRSKMMSVAPVAYKRDRSAQIARDMVNSELTALPVRQTLDMRENDNKYLVSFSLPKDVVEEHLKVEVAGNILTLVVKSENRTYMQRVRIPCDFAGESSLNHYVSNQLLIVEISK